MDLGLRCAVTIVYVCLVDVAAGAKCRSGLAWVEGQPGVTITPPFPPSSRFPLIKRKLHYGESLY